jgi:hypothetical protein
MPKKINLIIAVLITFFCLTLIDFEKVMAKDTDSQKVGGGYYDTGILENSPTLTKTNGAKKKKHHHRSKGSAKKNKNGVDQNPGGPQEDVTDQKEVSDQADQSNLKNKK